MPAEGLRNKMGLRIVTGAKRTEGEVVPVMGSELLVVSTKSNPSKRKGDAKGELWGDPC